MWTARSKFSRVGLEGGNQRRKMETSSRSLLTLTRGPASSHCVGWTMRCFTKAIRFNYTFSFLAGDGGFGLSPNAKCAGKSLLLIINPLKDSIPFTGVVDKLSFINCCLVVSTCLSTSLAIKFSTWLLRLRILVGALPTLTIRLSWRKGETAALFTY